MCSEKTFRPGCLRLWGDPLRKATPAFGNVPRKNIPARQLSAFGQSSAKSLASVRKCTPKRRSGQTTSGCLFPPTARLPKRPVAITRKSTAPDGLRLLVDPLRKTTQATRCDSSKKSSSRLPSAFGQSFSKNLPRRPVAITRKSTAPDCLRLLVNPFRKISPAARCDGLKKCNSGQPPALDLY